MESLAKAYNSKSYRVQMEGLSLDDDITFDQWIECGQHLWEVRRRIQWCIGDWLEYGEHRWGEKYAQAISVTEYSEQTLKNLANISKAFPDQKYRGQYHLSHSHFAAVAASDITPEKKTEFLEAAVANQMGRDDVRAAVKSWRGEPEAVKPWSVTCVPDNPEVTIRLPDEYVGQEVTITARVNGNGTN